MATQKAKRKLTPKDQRLINTVDWLLREGSPSQKERLMTTIKELNRRIDKR